MVLVSDRMLLCVLDSHRSLPSIVEGGARVLGDFLAQDLADEFQLAVAPFFVAEPGAPRLTLVPAGGPAAPMTLAETRRVGEMVLLRYLLGPGGPEHRFLRWAIELSRLCPPSGSRLFRRRCRRRRGR